MVVVTERPIESLRREQDLVRPLLWCVASRAPLLCCGGYSSPALIHTHCAAFWLSDKPLVQQDLASELARIIHSLSESSAVLYVQAFYETMERQWHTVDRLRYILAQSPFRPVLPAL